MQKICTKHDQYQVVIRFFQLFVKDQHRDTERDSEL